VVLKKVDPADKPKPLPSTGGGGILDDIARQIENSIRRRAVTLSLKSSESEW
jgi:hypothetical protein